MHANCLEFERPIAELEAKIEELSGVDFKEDVNIGDEIAQLREKSDALTRAIFAELTPWQVAQIARHPLRPHALDYISEIFTDFEELHGDRAFADDAAIVGGLARLEGEPVVVIGHQKGRDTKEKIWRNFAMPRPEGYRKALRLMRLAERFKLPVLTLVDTPGAYPGVDAEARGQSEAIAQNLLAMAGLRTSIVCTVIGEGGSGGALAVGVGDYVQMMQYATYAVISPEGCASILWKNAEKAELAAVAMGITSARLVELGLVDATVAEPLGAAHRDPVAAAETLKSALVEALTRLGSMTADELLAQRHRRLRGYGQFAQV
ncbi:MAG: acetyl-CoA carboxylase carboxyltransferase subunit alpha [Gammaproteobacteria bacterium]|nr:acetyl-CoA carboxylase carboxyltransferase subunit alpha [Gammaproteobacteria bacterium]